MSACFRIVHYLADLRLGTRLPIGALVEWDGMVTAVVASSAPSAQCLGDAQKVMLVEFLRAQLDEAKAFDELPRTMIPHALLDVARPVPSAVANPVRWVANLFETSQPKSGAKATKKPQRATRGAAALANLQVEHVEKPHFGADAQRSFGLLGDNDSIALPVVSNWVRGAGEAMLLEPVFVARSYELTIRTIRDLFYVYDGLFRERGIGRDAFPRIVYVPPGGDAEHRAAVTSAVRGHVRVASCVDLAKHDELSDLRKQTREFAAEQSIETLQRRSVEVSAFPACVVEPPVDVATCEFSSSPVDCAANAFRLTFGTTAQVGFELAPSHLDGIQIG